MNTDSYILSRILYFSIITIGVFTIFYQINFEDLWIDELNSFWVADPSLSYSETLARQNKQICLRDIRTNEEMILSYIVA